MQDAARRWLPLLIRGAVMVALLAWFASSVDWGEVRGALRGVRLWPQVAGVVALYALGQVANGLGWRHLVRGAGLEVGVGQMVRHDLSAVFYSTVLPGSVAGEVIKGARVAGAWAHAESTAVALLSARLVGGAVAGAWGLAWWTRAAMPSPARDGLAIAMAALVGVGLGGVVVLRLGPKAVRRVLPRLAERLPAGRAPRTPELAVCAACAAVAHASFCGVYALCFSAAGAELTYADAALITVASTAAQALPITLGGFGVRELTITGLGALLVPASGAAAASVLATLSFLVPVALGGVLEGVAPPARASTGLPKHR
ncbi:MAG: flippase-like domain-containing protein [Alphaproteobacteria bacterium]|nr:flippase-like domain-containing protein [Alphaproteobacteria bacterium]